MPKISVITVCRNAEKTIGRTIASVAHQTCKCFEYIVIDGASTDGTLELLQKHMTGNKIVVSEPDDGIYDAMNKGIRKATGEYLYFLGADDWLVDAHVLERVRAFIRRHPGYSFYMGNVFLYQENLQLIKRQRGNLSAEDIKYGNMCPHQGLFARRDSMEEGFDTHYKIAADYEFLLRNIVKGKSFCPMDLDVAYYSLFGASADMQLYDEYSTIIKSYLGAEYLRRIDRLRDVAGNGRSLRKMFKRLLQMSLGEKRLLQWQGWKEVHKRESVHSDRCRICWLKYSDVAE